MKNTGITYTSAERSPVILPEMAELLPPLSAEQLDALEADLIKNGCYSPIIVNEDMVIIDGHNRQALCEKHGLPYTMAVFSFEDMLEAKQWALDTQKGRRNLEKWELGKIALKLKPEIEAKAKANMAAGGQNFRPSEAEEGSATLPNLPSVEKAVDTRKELAEAVGLGERTMGKVIQIDENAPDAIKEALDNWTRYYALNLHSVFYRGTVEWRCFNSTLHAGKVAAYVNLCLAISAQAIAQRSTVMRKTHSDNELFTFRVWLVRLGLNGDEFKNTRNHLLANLEGDRAYRYDKDTYEANKKKKKSRERER